MARACWTLFLGPEPMRPWALAQGLEAWAHRLEAHPRGVVDAWLGGLDTSDLSLRAKVLHPLALGPLADGGKVSGPIRPGHLIIIS